jgi:quercetin dioxygenase-like cupin family protein
MNRNRGLVVFLIMLAVLAFGQAAARFVELDQEPHYKQLLNNDAVRVWMVELEPQESTRMHRHPQDYLLIQLQDAETSTTKLTEPPSAPTPKPFNEGEMWYVPRVTHAVKNDSRTTAMRTIEIELRKRGPSGDYIRDRYNDINQPKYFPPPTNPYGNYRETGTFYNVFLTRSQLLAGASSEMHEHKAPHLVVALSDLELKDEVEGRGVVTFKLNKGEVRWVEGGFRHKLTNTGRGPAQVVTVEYR